MFWLYSIVSVVFVSLLSLIGFLFLPFGKEKLGKVLIYFVSFSAGTLLGDAFIHLIPESYEMEGNKMIIPFFILSGIAAFFLLEKFVHWRHCHKVACEDHPHPFSYTILAGDTIHNFIDGLIIGASYLVSIPVGIATTVAVIFHEIPQEVGDFGSLVYGGFTKIRALFLNFLTALAAILGTVAVLIFSDNFGIIKFLVPFAAGGFIYVALSDLIPELHRHTDVKKSSFQISYFLLGIALMAALLFIFE
jgi:zinc and cadmium transporter